MRTGWMFARGEGLTRRLPLAEGVADLVRGVELVELHDPQRGQPVLLAVELLGLCCDEFSSAPDELSAVRP